MGGLSGWLGGASRLSKGLGTRNLVAGREHNSLS